MLLSDTKIFFKWRSTQTNLIHQLHFHNPATKKSAKNGKHKANKNIRNTQANHYDSKWEIIKKRSIFYFVMSFRWKGWWRSYVSMNLIYFSVMLHLNYCLWINNKKKCLIFMRARNIDNGNLNWYALAVTEVIFGWIHSPYTVEN